MFNKHMARLLAILLALMMYILPVMVSAQEDLIGQDQIIQQEVTYRTDTVQRGTFVKETTFSAAEYYPCSWKVACPKNGAIFVEYAVSQGAQVKAGDVLVRLSGETDSIALERLERELLRMQEEFAAAVSEKQEKITAAEAKLPALTDGFEKEQLEISIKILRVELEQFCYLQQRTLDAKQQEVDDARNAQKVMELTAPADGTVTALTAKNPEDPVAIGEVLVTLIRTDIRLLQVKDPATELRSNMPVTITIGKGDNQKILTGRVVAAEDRLAPEYRSGYAYVLPDPGAENVVFRDVRITAATVSLDNVLLADRRSVTLENAKVYVTKLSDGALQRRGILLGTTNATHAWIIAGVAEGDILILD